METISAIMEVQETSLTNNTSVLRKSLRTTSSTLLKGLANFLCRRCSKVEDLSPSDLIMWIEWIDGYVDRMNFRFEKFFCKGSIVFLYMICRESISPEIISKREFKSAFFTCAFVTYSYLTLYDVYPVGLFSGDSSPRCFTERCLSIVRSMSSKMMKINKNRQYYLKVLIDLKAEAERANNVLTVNPS